MFKVKNELFLNKKCDRNRPIYIDNYGLISKCTNYSHNSKINMKYIIYGTKTFWMYVCIQRNEKKDF